MKALRSRTMVVAMLVVAGSMVTGIGLGLVLTKVVRAGDKARVAAKSPKKKAGRLATRRGNSRSNASAVAGRSLTLPPAGAGQGANTSPDFKGIPFDPRTLPLYHKQYGSPTPVGTSHTSSQIVPLPMWNYSVTVPADLGGGTYPPGTPPWTAQIMGRDPRAHGKTTTTISMPIIPVIVTVNGRTYDPTIPDTCQPNHSAVDITTGSPLFTNNTWTMNGVNVGNTQYIDANQRAQFWSYVGGTNYHLVFQFTVLPSVRLTLPGQTYQFNNPAFHCSTFAAVDINVMDNALQSLIAPGGPYAGTVNVGNFPMFIMRNVVETEVVNGQTECCILGYHSGFYNNGQLQVYSPFDLDTIGGFGPGFTDTMSHEVAEAVNDPTGFNLTPTWGNIGQTLGVCQNNFEVGDPLSEGFGTPSKPFSVVGANGLTYSTQELAFFSWFYGGPSLGAGGLYSNNGSFKGYQILCANGGGTN